MLRLASLQSIDMDHFMIKKKRLRAEHEDQEPVSQGDEEEEGDLKNDSETETRNPGPEGGPKLLC